MRINFNLDTSLTNRGAFEPPQWLRQQVESFCREWDLDHDKHAVQIWLTDPATGLKEFIAWLTEQGWKAEYYEMEVTMDEEDGWPLGYGIHFDKSCQRLMEERLSQ